MLLTIELIPSSAWGKNLRLLPPEIWDPIRRGCYRRARYRCEVCSGVGPTHPVECHEKWAYGLQGLPPRKVQKLVGIVALCPDCHSVKHMGRTRKSGGSFLQRARDEVREFLHPGGRKRARASEADVLECISRTVESLALDHLARVNGWTPREAYKHEFDAFTAWHVREPFMWEVDLTLFGGPHLPADDSHADALNRTYG